MKARRLPGVRCSTEKTECRSLLCLMIMPGRSCVAGIDIAEKLSCKMAVFAEPAERACPERAEGRARPQVPPLRWQNFILHSGAGERKPSRKRTHRTGNVTNSG